MRRFIFMLTCFLILSLSSFAKRKSDCSRAEIKVSYNYHKKFMRGNTEFVEMDIPMLLLVNSEKSKFYNKWTEYRDSLDSTPSGRAYENEMNRMAAIALVEKGDMTQMDNISYKTFMYVFKDYPEQQTMVYDKAGLTEYGVYNEPFSELTWQIGDSVKTVLGYECVMATTDYHGRKWTVWFAPEIPVNDGPWKLCGLPGLILEATEPKGHHHFVADGIEQSNQSMYPIYNKDKYERMDRVYMLKNLRNYYDNSNSIVEASTFGMLDLGPDAKPQTEYDFLEIDYR